MTTEELAESAAAIRETVGRLEPVGRRRRYGAQLREEILRYLEAGSARGRSPEELTAAIGVPVKTAARWRLQRRRGGGQVMAGSAAIVPVSLRADGAKPRTGLVVVTPAGVRLEGLDVPAAISVLRALG